MNEPRWVRWLLIVIAMVFLLLFLFVPLAVVFSKAFEKAFMYSPIDPEEIGRASCRERVSLNV